MREIRTSDFCAVPNQVSPDQECTGWKCWSPSDATRHRARQVGARQVCARQVGAGQVRIHQVRVRTDELSLRQDPTSRQAWRSGDRSSDCPRHVSPGEIRSGQIRTSQLGLD